MSSETMTFQSARIKMNGGRNEYFFQPYFGRSSVFRYLRYECLEEVAYLLNCFD